MRRTALVASTLALVLTGASAASAATGGTGTVVDTLAATVVGGALVLTGSGANVALSSTPGNWSTAAGATVLNVTDGTLTTNGWAVTATYGDPATGNPLGAANVEVSAGSVTGAVLGTALNLATNQPLTSPVTVASTGLAGGAGTTLMTASYRVKVPTTATLGQVYGATVTYTVASVR